MTKKMKNYSSENRPVYRGTNEKQKNNPAKSSI